MVPVHDYVKRYAEAFAITKIRTFKHEPFFIVGGGGGGLFVVLYGTTYLVLTDCAAGCMIIELVAPAFLPVCVYFVAVKSVAISEGKNFREVNCCTLLSLCSYPQ